MLAEVGLRKGSEAIDGVQDPAVFVVKAHFFVDGAVVIGVGVATENSEVGVLVLEDLFGLQLVLVELEPEVVEVDDVSDFEIEGEVLLLVAPDVDLEGLGLVGGVDDFELLGEVPVFFVAVGSGCVDDEPDGGVELVLLPGLLIFVVLLPGLLEAENLSVLLHNS